MSRRFYFGGHGVLLLPEAVSTPVNIILPHMGGMVVEGLIFVVALVDGVVSWTAMQYTNSGYLSYLCILSSFSIFICFPVTLDVDVLLATSPFLQWFRVLT